MAHLPTVLHVTPGAAAQLHAQAQGCIPFKHFNSDPRLVALSFLATVPDTGSGGSFLPFEGLPGVSTLSSAGMHDPERCCCAELSAFATALQVLFNGQKAYNRQQDCLGWATKEDCPEPGV